jgi:hypothetical protein
VELGAHPVEVVLVAVIDDDEAGLPDAVGHSDPA